MPKYALNLCRVLIDRPSLAWRRPNVPVLWTGEIMDVMARLSAARPSTRFRHARMSSRVARQFPDPSTCPPRARSHRGEQRRGGVQICEPRERRGRVGVQRRNRHQARELRCCASATRSASAGRSAAGTPPRAAAFSCCRVEADLESTRSGSVALECVARPVEGVDEARAVHRVHRVRPARHGPCLVALQLPDHVPPSIDLGRCCSAATFADGFLLARLAEFAAAESVQDLDVAGREELGDRQQGDLGGVAAGLPARAASRRSRTRASAAASSSALAHVAAVQSSQHCRARSLPPACPSGRRGGD